MAKKSNKKLIWEAVKEPLRLMVIAVLPFAIAYFSELNYSWALVLVVLLRGVDKYMYLAGKESKDKRLAKGLTRF